MPHVYISIGSNVDQQKNIFSCLNVLHKHFKHVRASVIYENKAVGFDGDNFYNLVAGFETDMNVRELMALFRQIECDHGRVRGGEKFSSRTLDLDLLLYDDLILKEQGLDVPRAEITQYEFVLRPLAELAPELIHPELKVSMLSLWQVFEPKEDMRAISLPNEITPS